MVRGRRFIFLTICILAITYLLPIRNQYVEASTSATYKYVVDISALNIRSKPSLKGSVVGTVKKGQSLKVNKTINKDWLQIVYKSKNAYVSSKYVKKIPYVRNVALSLNTKNAPNELTFTAKPVGGENISYQFAVKGEKGKWSVAQRYSKKATYLCRPTSDGNYIIRVYAKSGGTTDSEATYTEFKCVVSNLQLVNMVDTSVSTSDDKYYEVKGISNLAEQSQFKIQILEGGTWVTKLSYAQGVNAFTWRPIKNGQYTIRIFARHVKSTKDYDVMKELKVPISGVEDFQTLDLRKKSNVTANEINQYIAKFIQRVNKPSKLTNEGQTIIDVANMYNINAQFLAALMIHESGYGTSYLAHFKNNLTGLAAFDSEPYDSAVRFSNVRESITYAAQFVRSRYLNENATYNYGPYLGFKDVTNPVNSKGMNASYASDPEWGMLIANHMENIKPYDANYYDTQSIIPYMEVVNTRPDLSDKYPEFSLAKAQSTIYLYKSKGDKNEVSLRKLKIGEIFTPLEKTNDFYLKVKVDNTIYWTRALPISDYVNYFYFINVLRVTNRNLGSVTMYDAPDGKNSLGTIENFSYIQAKLNDKQEVESQNGYDAIVWNGKEAWIASSMINEVYSK